MTSPVTPLAMSSKCVERFPRWRQSLLGLPAMATVLCAHQGFAAVPAIVTDAQQTLSTNISGPQGIAVAPNGTVYVADTNNNRVVQILPNLPGASTQTTVVTPTLTGPQSVAVDAAGDLYISDTPILGLTVRITEMVANSSGALTGSSVSKTLYSGALLTQALSLAVNSSNTLFIGAVTIFGNGIDYIPSGDTLKALTVTGIPGYTPAGLAVSGNNLFIANSASNDNGIYMVSTSGGAASQVPMGTFTVKTPQGLAVDGSGDLFVLAKLGTGPTGEQVLEVPGASASPSSPYIIPSNNLVSNGGLAIDPLGNLDVAGTTTSAPITSMVTQLDFLNPVYLGAAGVYQSGTAVVFNFEFNSPATFTGLRAITTGDPGATNNDVAPVTGSAGGTCTAGGATSATVTVPFTCNRQFQATPQYVGARASSVQVQGGTSAVLNSTAVWEVGQAAAQITYPLDTVQTQLGLIQPQGVTISGFDQTVYLADYLSGQVYSISALNGASATKVATSPITLSAPAAVAMNGKGDLYIADFGLGAVVVVPTTTGILPYVLNTGNLLKHPIALAVDALGDLYIGDAGSGGESASNSNPGFVVEVTYGGSAFQLPTNGVSTVFPQALAFNNINGVLAIGDGGDGNTALPQVVAVTANGNASVVSITNSAAPEDPSGLSFDAAGNLYVLDGFANTITEVFTNGTTALLPFSAPSALNASSAMASSAGSQSFVVTNLGGGTQNSLVYLNGNSTSLAFGNQVVSTVSASQSVTVANIGNQNLTYNSTTSLARFPLTGGTCASGNVLTSLTTCSLGFAFAPIATNAYNKTSVVSSNAYNSGIPVINLSGTGTVAGGNFPPGFFAPPAPNRARRFGRKAFWLERSR